MLLGQEEGAPYPRIVSFGKEDNDDLRFAIGNVDDYDDLVIERVRGMGMVAGNEIFDTCEWAGRLYEMGLAWKGVQNVYLVSRAKVKSILGGRNDSALRARCIEILGPPGTKPAPGPTYGIIADCWQALALGLAHLRREEN